jgi:predicted phage terminase large subunit-like protein
MFKREWWKYVDIAPAGMRLIRRWDKAGTAGAGDWTAGVLMGRDDEGFIYVLDVRRIQGSPLQVESFIAATAELDREKYGRRVKIRLEQEPGSSGKSVAERYIREVLAGYAVSAKPSTGSKELRAEPFAAQCEGGNVFLVRRPGDSGFHAQKWWEMFIDEAAEFPRGSNDDMIDAASQAFNDLVGKKAHGRASTAAGQHITPAQDGGRLYIVGSA